jgi:hypothetical protein
VRKTAAEWWVVRCNWGAAESVMGSDERRFGLLVSTELNFGRWKERNAHH